jgi:hypothetical protein
VVAGQVAGNSIGGAGAPGFGGGGVLKAVAVALFGGAIFIRSGQLDVVASSFNNNKHDRFIEWFSRHGQRRCGVRANICNAGGNDQGMPPKLPKVTGCANTFSGNTATNAGGTDVDNAATFGVSRLALAQSCDILFADGFDPVELPP